MAYALEHMDGSPVFESDAVLVSGPLPSRGHVMVFETEARGLVHMRVIRVEHRIGTQPGGPVAFPVAIVEQHR